MTLFLPTGLPALAALQADGIGRVAGMEDAAPDPNRLRVALVNLMPDKPVTELQFARQLAQWPGSVELVLARPASHVSSRADPEHLRRFYVRIPEIGRLGLDGLIVTGAPVEHLPFEQVHYWRELTALIDRAAAARLPSLYVCWSGQAALYHRHGVPKHPLARKAFGVFPQVVECPDAAVLRGVGERFPCPVSRHTEVRREDLPHEAGLHVLAASPPSGLCLVEDRPAAALMMFNHLEYAAGTLIREYRRDRSAGCDIAPPEGIDMGDGADPALPWRYAAERFFTNWLDQVATRRRNRLRTMGDVAKGAPDSDRGLQSPNVS